MMLKQEQGEEQSVKSKITKILKRRLTIIITTTIIITIFTIITVKLQVHGILWVLGI